MTMDTGRMVFSKNHQSGHWYAESHLDEDHAGYWVKRHPDGGWSAQFVRRLEDQTNAHAGEVLMERVDLGWGHYLFTAKGFCDAHHHRAIMAGDRADLKRYITRWVPSAAARAVS